MCISQTASPANESVSKYRCANQWLYRATSMEQRHMHRRQSMEAQFFPSLALHSR